MINSKHALVGKSIVQHIVNGSLGLLKDPDAMLGGMGALLAEKRGNNEW